jgi:Coenzyme PQQ synthesis protein D (PqqD)
MMEYYYEINVPKVISEPMDDELVVINLDNGCYYSLNKTAAFLWNQLEYGCSINQAARQAVQLYGIEETMVLADFTGFVEHLMQEQLIRAGNGVPTNGLPFKEGQGVSYLKPSFEKYSDMQEMLLLDPIHEVSEDGWPHQEKK